MKIIEHVRNISEKVGKKISDICDTTTLRELAKKSGFVKRSTSRMEGEDFVRLMTTEILRGTRKERAGCFPYGLLISVVQCH